MSDINIGTVQASVALNLSQLGGDTSKAEQMIQNMTVNIEQTVVQKFGSIEKQVAGSAKRMAAEQLAALSKISNAFTLLGTGMVGAMSAGVKAGADFEAMLNHVANNTSLTTDEIKLMRDTVIALGTESGASFEELAKGFQKIVSVGFTAAEAPLLLREAMKAAVSTGADVEKTADALSSVMHEFGMKTEDAARTMNTLAVASKDGKSNLEQWVAGTGQAYAMAANLGASFTDVTAAMVALTRHGMSVAEAGTQIKNVFVHMAEPGQSVRKILDQVSQASGVDLVRAFTVAGQSGHGMRETLDLIKEAAQRAGLDATDLELKLIHAMRGGLGAMVLTKTGAKDFTEEIAKLEATLRGEVDPTTGQYIRTLETLDQQLKRAKNELTLMADDIERALLPAIRPLIASVRDVADWFQKLDPDVKTADIKLVAFGGSAVLAIGILGKLVTALLELRTALIALGSAEVFAALGPLAVIAAGGAGVYLAAKQLWTAADRSTKATHEYDGQINYWKGKKSEEERFLENRQQALAGETNPDRRAAIETAMAGIKTRIAEDAKRIADLTADAIRSAQAKIAESAGGSGLGSKIAEHMLHDDVDTSAVKETCARFVSGILKNVGAAVKASDSAHVLRDNLVAAGAVVVDKSQAQAGDIIYQEGVKRRDGSRGNHIEFYAGNDWVRSSSGGRVSSHKFSDNGGQSTFYRLPDKAAIPGGEETVAEFMRKQKAKADATKQAKRDAESAREQAQKDAAREAADHRREAEQKAKEDAEARAENQKAVYKLTHSRFDVEREDATQQYREDKTHMDSAQAYRRYALTMKDIAERESADLIQTWTERVDREEEANKASADKKRQKIEESARLDLEEEQQERDAAQREKELHDAAAKSGLNKFDAARVDAKNQFDKDSLISYTDALTVLQNSLKAVDQDEHDFNTQQRQEADDKARRERELMDERVDEEYKTGRIQLEYYLQYLRERQSATERDSDENKKLHKRMDEAGGRQAPTLHKELRTLASGMESIFETSLNALFNKGFKGFFSSIVQGFAQMIEQMIVKWLVFQALTGIFGANVFGTGAKGNGKGFFGFLGFDDPHNDATARRWGFDFGNYFRGGISDSFRTRTIDAGGKLASANGVPTGGHTVNVQVDNLHVSSDMDVRTFSQRLAWHTKTQLVGLPAR